MSSKTLEYNSRKIILVIENGHPGFKVETWSPGAEFSGVIEKQSYFSDLREVLSYINVVYSCNEKRSTIVPQGRDCTGGNNNG